MKAKITGGATSAIAASSHAGCARFRGTDPLITGVTRRKLAQHVGYSKGPQSTIPLLRWMRAMTFERMVRDKRFASEVVTVAVGALELPRPKAVVVADAQVNAAKTATILGQAHTAAVRHGNATLVHELAVPFPGLEGENATDTRPDFAVVAPRVPDKSGAVSGSWLILGDAKDYQRVRSHIDDGRLLKGFLQVALGAESAARWTKLPTGMSVHGFGVLAVPRNTSLSPTAVIEDLTDHRAEVRMRVAERAAEVAAYSLGGDQRDGIEAGASTGVDGDLAAHLNHLQATYSPDSCPSCDMFIYCRAELQSSADPGDLLIELGIRPEERRHAVGLVDGVTSVGRVATSVRHQIEATVTGRGVWSGQRRLDPIGQPGTIHVVVAKSDGATLGVYGIGIQRVTTDGAEPWTVSVFDNPDSDRTRRSIMKSLGEEIDKALAEQVRTAAVDRSPVHIVVPDSPTSDLLVSIADSVAGKELSRLRWARDQRQGRPALTFNGEQAVLPPRLTERERVAVSFLLEQDRARTMKVRSTIVDLRAALAGLVTAGGPAVNSLRLDYLAPWSELTSAPIDHRSLAEVIEKSDHAVGAQLSPTMSNAIHEAFTGARQGLPRPADPAAYDDLVRAEIGYKIEVFNRAFATLTGEFETSRLRDIVRAVEGDAQRVWRRRLELHAFDLVRFGRTTRVWRNNSVPLLEADQMFDAQVTVLTSPLAAYDAAQDAGIRPVALARVTDLEPLTLEVDSRRIGDESRIVALHHNGNALIEAEVVTSKTMKGSFKFSHMPIGGLSAVEEAPRRFTWMPRHDPGFALGDELVVADFAWFSENSGDAWLCVARPRVDTSSAPRIDCQPESFGEDPANHQWCCKPHEEAEAEWSDILAGRRARGEMNPEVWPPVIDPDGFDVSAVGEALPDPTDRPAEEPPEDLTMDDVE